MPQGLSQVFNLEKKYLVFSADPTSVEDVEANSGVSTERVSSGELPLPTVTGWFEASSLDIKHGAVSNKQAHTHTHQQLKDIGGRVPWAHHGSRNIPYIYMWIWAYTDKNVYIHMESVSK